MVQFQKDILEQLPAFVYLLGNDFTIHYTNKHFKNYFGDHQGKLCYQIIQNRNEPCENCILSNVLETSDLHERELVCSEKMTVQVLGTPFIGKDGMQYVLALGVDISERRMNELLLRRSHDELGIRVKRRTEELYSLNVNLQREMEKHRQTSLELRFQEEMSSAIANLKKALLIPSSLEEIPNLILEKAKLLTGSDLGFVGYVNPRTGHFVNSTMAENSWTTGNVEGEQTLLEHVQRLWTWVLQHRKPLLNNDSNKDRRTTGMSDGHQSVRRLLCVPALFNNHPVGVITLANPKQDYTSRDLEVVERLANIYALSLHRKLEEEKLLWTNQHLYAVLEASPLPIMVANRYGKVTLWNHMARKTFGWSHEELQNLEFPIMFSNNDAQRFKAMHEEVLQGTAVGTTELQAKSKNNFYLDVVVFSAPVQSVDEPGKVCCVIYIMDDITADKQMENALRDSESQLRNLSAQLLDTLEKERKRIALELHDRIGQSLTAIKFCVESALVQNDPQKRKTLLSGVTMLQNSIDEVRKIALDLRPSMLDDLGLLATANWFCREFAQIYPHIRITKRFFVKKNQVPEPLKIVIYRVMQEAFNNIAKHSKASKVFLMLKKSNNSLHLKIDDNGCGMPLEKRNTMSHHASGLGLTSMREQTEISGGHFEIVSAPEKGTTIRCVWPL